MVLRLLGTVVLLSSLTAFAGEADCPQEDAPTVADQLAQHVKGCPNNTHPQALCLQIEMHSKNPDDLNQYAYERQIFENSCVSPSDSDEIKRQKIKEFWNIYGKNITCQSLNFNQPNGNLIKFAIAKLFDNFVVIMAHKWKVDLNRVDPADGRTALDYAYDEYAKEQTKSPAVANKIKTYITVLEKNGAKRAKDL